MADEGDVPAVVRVAEAIKSKVVGAPPGQRWDAVIQTELAAVPEDQRAAVETLIFAGMHLHHQSLGGQPTGRLDPRFFWVGCALLLAAFALGGVAFNMRDLTSDQRSILNWLFSLVSGFSAASFTGSVTANLELGKKATAVAVGGAAVWLLTYFFPVFS